MLVLRIMFYIVILPYYTYILSKQLSQLVIFPFAFLLRLTLTRCRIHAIQELLELQWCPRAKVSKEGKEHKERGKERKELLSNLWISYSYTDFKA